MSEPHDIPESLPTQTKVEPVIAVPVVTTAQAIRFCNRCGAPWQIDWDQCQLCAAKALKTPPPPDLLAGEEKRAIIKAVALYGMMLAVSIITTVIAIASREDFGFAGMCAEEIAFAIIILAWATVSWPAVWPLLPRTGSPRWLVAGPLLGVVTFIVASSAVVGMKRVLELPDLEYLGMFTDAGYGLGMATLLIAVYPAIFEELAFRGVILDSLQKVLSSTEAIFVSGAMFAILHLSIPSFFHLFLMGVVLAWLRQRSRALLPCMLLHFTHNFLVLLVEQQEGLLPW